MDIEGSSVEVKMISNGHFDLSSGKEVQPCVNRASWCLGAGSSRAKRWAKGIKVPPGKTFQYKAQDDGYSIYIFEVGLHPRHIKTVQKSIHIYVIHNGRRLFIATLSSSCPKVRVEVMMTEGMELAHTSLRKAVYFNTFEFKAMKLHKSSLLNTNNELWVVKVKSCQESAFDPIGEGKKFHLLKAFSVRVIEEDMEVTEENISLYVRCGDKYYQIGKISPTGTSLFGRVEYDCEFSLSHTSESSDVIFIGYTVPDSASFQLRELPHVAHQKLSLRPPKESDDPENSAYQELSAKRAAKLEGVTTSTRDDDEDQVLKLTNISLVPAPIISGTRFSLIGF